MIGYRTLRYIASLSVGVIALVGLFAFLWAFTKVSLPAICFWCMVVYVGSASAIWTLSAPQKKKLDKEAPIVNLRKEEWDEH